MAFNSILVLQVVLVSSCLTDGLLTDGSGATAITPVRTETSTDHVSSAENSNTSVPDYVNKTVCFGILGCFSNIPPFDNGASLLPLPPSYLNSTFTLHTRRTLNGEEVDYQPDFNVTATAYNPKMPTKIIAHGFTQNSSVYWMQNMLTAFLNRDDFNVILVDWANGAAFPNYPLCIPNARVVGTQLYLLIKHLLAAGGSLDNIHCIGHSLGAHLCGHTGMLFNGKLQRITGMDAAGPEYDGNDPQVRLDPTDAQFVDAIHTNAAPLYIGGLGIHQEVGHTDFYVNGGASQPGCPAITSALGDLLNGDEGFGAAKKAVSCSHSRSHEFFVESIGTLCPFKAYPCKSAEDFENGLCVSCGKSGCSQLGYNADTHGPRGRMYLDTSADSPYCGYHYFVRLETNQTDTKGKVMLKLKGSLAESDWVMATRYEDDPLKPGHPVQRAVITRFDVGSIMSVKIRYKQTHGFWFFGGKENWDWQRVEITSGIDSKKYTVCSNGTALHDSVDNEFTVGASC